MDIYVQIKNKKGEIFKVVNLGREEYFEFFKERLNEIKDEDDFPIFFTEFKINNYLDVTKVKQLKEEIKNIAGVLEKDIDTYDIYRELLKKRAQVEADILNCSSLKNLMIIGANRLKEMVDEIDQAGIENEPQVSASSPQRSSNQRGPLETKLKAIYEEICKLDENELLLDKERDKLKALFDVELLFDTLLESIKSSSGIYIKN